MCLHINFDYHSGRKPKVADRPLVVKKRLSKNESKFYTPYQRTVVEFGRTYNNSFQFENDMIDVINSGQTIMSYGHHSFRYNTTINDFAFDRPTLINISMVWVYGVIPAGTRFYVGIDNDIVSESIVYYKTLDDLKEAYGCKKLGEPVHINQL